MVYAAQLLPLTGVFLMLLLGPFWIGVIVNIYFVNIIAECTFRRIPKGFVLLPLAYFGAGIGTGLYSDVMTWQWKSQQTWLQVEGSVPSSVRYLGFEPSRLIAGRDLDMGIDLRPDQYSFEMIRRVRNDASQVEYFELLIYHSDPAPTCFRAGREALQIGGRCYTLVRIDKPKSFVVIGGKSEQRTMRPSPSYAWAMILTGRVPIVLHNEDSTHVVGHLLGGIVRKHAYIFFPTAGCGLTSSRPSWDCFWSFFSRWRDEPVGFHTSTFGSSSDTVPILMSALKEIRGNPQP